MYSLSLTLTASLNLEFEEKHLVQDTTKKNLPSEGSAKELNVAKAPRREEFDLFWVHMWHLKTPMTLSWHSCIVEVWLYSRGSDSCLSFRDDCLRVTVYAPVASQSLTEMSWEGLEAPAHGVNWTRNCDCLMWFWTEICCLYYTELEVSIWPLISLFQWIFKKVHRVMDDCEISQMCG